MICFGTMNATATCVPATLKATLNALPPHREEHSSSEVGGCGGWLSLLLVAVAAVEPHHEWGSDGALSGWPLTIAPIKQNTRQQT